MKKLVAFVALIAVLLSAFAPPTLSEDLTAIDYVESLGFSIADQWDTPGWRTCYLLETADSQTLAFSDDVYAYCIVSGPLITVPFDESVLRNLFVDLLTRFDWDISFFGPDNDVEDQFALSYGITNNLDKTKQNFTNQDEYIAAFEEWLAEDEAAAWQALHDKIDSWNVPEIETSSITDCIAQITGARPLSAKTMDGAVTSCAQYIIFPEYVFAGPGGKNPSLAKFLHPTLETWDFEEQWGVYGNIVKYIRDHSDQLLADGLALSDGNVNSTVCISIYTDLQQYISFYDLTTGEISTSIVDN